MDKRMDSIDETMEVNNSKETCDENSINDSVGEINRDVHDVNSEKMLLKEEELELKNSDGKVGLLCEITSHSFLSTRVQSAITRIKVSPFDVEAWQAILTEAQNLFKTNKDKGVFNFIEGCYGNLLKYFPYASDHIVKLVEMLYERSELVDGVESEILDKKLELIFAEKLGVDDFDVEVENNMLGGMCTSSVDLWLFYIKKRIRDFKKANMSTKELRESTVKTYETAVHHAGFVVNCHRLWREYLRYVENWSSSDEDHVLNQTQNMNLRGIYQRMISTPMENLDEFWREYEKFEKNLSEALSAALLGEHLPKFQHAKHVYEEKKSKNYLIDFIRLSVRLPIEPDGTEEISRWRRRCYYERTNPERLQQSQILLQRVRQCYKEMTCGLMRHPEIWYEWSSWELSHGDHKKSIAVLKLGTKILPDSAFLMFSLVELYESFQNINYNDKLMKGSDVAINILETFMKRNPTSLGFVMLQKLMRQYKGIEAARKVFTQARYLLGSSKVDNSKSTIIQSLHKEEEKEVEVEKKNPMTWHVYATHASIEHHLNYLPQVAARVYELGLKKHPEFLGIPKYVLPYAHLLLFLRKKQDAKSLLLRSIAVTHTNNPKSLWDLLFFLELSSRNTIAPLKEVELKRYKALYGNLYAEGVDGTQENLEGVPKHLLDQLLFSEDSSFWIGLGKFIDRLEVIGLLDDDTTIQLASGSSDELFFERYKKHRRQFLINNLSTDAPPKNKVRERFTTMAGTVQPFVQKFPEWLNPLIQLLPTNKTNKKQPPPHLIEITLNLLKANTLPPLKKTNKRKKNSLNDDSSSDEETQISGYGNQFKKRQKARLAPQLTTLSTSS